VFLIRIVYTIMNITKDIETVTNNVPHLLSRRQVAAMMGLHTETIKRYQRRGILPAIVLNSRVTRYDPADVERLINEGRVVQ